MKQHEWTKKYGEKVADAIIAGKVLKDMTAEQVRLARGEPLGKELIPPDAERWRYPEGDVYFSGGKVSYEGLKERRPAPTATPAQQVADAEPKKLALPVPQDTPRKPATAPATEKPSPAKKPKPEEVARAKKPGTGPLLGESIPGGKPAPLPEPPRQAFEPEMVSLKGGCYLIGSIESESGRNNDERQHQVCVQAFKIGKYEVTQGEWRAVMGNNPTNFANCGDRCPVEMVNWNEVQNYLDQLNARTGKRYRLPTEAEWEYACRGGREGDLYCGGNDIESLAWLGGGFFSSGNAGGKTHPAGQKAANGFGLYDMSGNVGEWTCSEYDPYYRGAEIQCASKNRAGLRSSRGGAYYNPPVRVRAAIRNRYTPESLHDGLGFRLVQD